MRAVIAMTCAGSASNTVRATKIAGTPRSYTVPPPRRRCSRTSSGSCTRIVASLLDVFTLQALPELVVRISRRAMLLRERVGASTVGRDDCGEPRLSPCSPEGRQERALDERPCAHDGVADLLGHELLPLSFPRGMGASVRPWNAVATLPDDGL